MSRRTRIALLAAAALVVAVTGTVLATRQPQGADEPAQLTQDTPPTAEELAHAESRLEDAIEGLEVDPALLNELATQYGLGGAVRLVAWSADNPRDLDMAAIRRMRDGDGTEGSEMGWGQIAKDIGVHPGIGSIMGNGGGNGRDNAPGQNRDEGDASGG